ncbi:hypothetical protein [Methylobacterium frigidaeris]|uniref:Uncharacterized protein n=1 Tax=Methylobacterium frigidaeris TaxID=2038277 RepID=A0AA37M8Y0_9HYPH|nr:hypothetical protein [Methylobacterium frigidaeris]PIK72060.1 hypothetical protein CS379_16045 [Methylobacterium frigidaeris]GJD66819.1 hypothetical protein MPEAHAMD_7018 [Methylobacterium frigidaeris]
MTHPPANPEPLDLAARELHEHARQRIEGCPAWEDFDITDPYEAGLIRLAYDRARDFNAISGGDEG